HAGLAGRVLGRAARPVSRSCSHPPPPPPLPCAPLGVWMATALRTTTSGWRGLAAGPSRDQLSVPGNAGPHNTPPRRGGTPPSPLLLSDYQLERVEIGCAEDNAVARRDVDEVEVDAGRRDAAGEISEHAGPVLDVDDRYLALAGDGDVGVRERVAYR